jgi:pyruvate-formate lyase-activating enzyme
VYPGAGAAAYEVPNPLTVDSAVGRLLRVARDYPPTDVVSITGGEPLEQADFVREVAASIKRAGKRVYLETNGVHDEALAAVLPWTDVVAMDIKLPSATRAPLWAAHRAFLERLENTAFVPRSRTDRTNGKMVFVKVVIDDRSTRQEVESAAAMIASTSPAIPLVLQPESGLFLEDTSGGERAEKLKAALADCHDAAVSVLDNVRIVPQMHRLLDVR